ncbi:MAG TPA: LptA/OstA family protein [Candidatus Dormibacteraeota bacterium]|nr:LptA/OstA family protein [Candidatus Dormibacteraeota bacterium]
MPLRVYRLRRLLAATAVLLILVVAGMYSYARWRTYNVLRTIPGKIGIEIKQTAHGFQFSKSDGKRTIFTIQASDVKEFKFDGNAELRNVSIVLYGRDSSRYDQIYGDDFAYNQKTGDVTAKGDVQIDLVANPAGLASPDQSMPKELKNPIHLRTRDLIFNKNSGNASTAARVEFRTAQAAGWAVGAKYSGESNELTLSSQIHVTVSGPNAMVIEADHGTVINDPREIVLEHPHLDRESGSLQAEHAVFYLGAENKVERVVATGNVTAEMRKLEPSTSAAAAPAAAIHGRADRAEFLLAVGKDLLHTATLSGKVHFEQTGTQAMQGDAGRAIFDFAGQNQLQKIHAVDGARLSQRGGSQPAGHGADAQDFELTAPAIDFIVANGHVLKQGTTSGAAQITIIQPPSSDSVAPAKSPGQQTVVTAGRFVADFAPSEGKNRLSSLHGAPDARIVNSIPGQPDRVSTSDSVDAAFLPQGGLESVTQKGNVHYSDGEQADKRTQAWANLGHYTPADHVLVLTGSPRVANGGMATTANSIRINRATGDALAEGDVKSTYSDLKEQPDGALLASSSPIHVTAKSMTARNSPGIALYTGDARLWQDTNVIEAPSIQFDRDRRLVTAQGASGKPVRTILIQAEKDGARSQNAGEIGKQSSHWAESSPISITAMKLTYADSERTVHYEGGVVAEGAEFIASSKTADAYLLPHSKAMNNKSFNGAGQLDRIVARDDVVIQQPNRRAQGQQLVYTAVDDKFVLTGGPPSIFDAEQGKITGVSLTFFKRDDRVLVEGEVSTPVVTTTRVAR